MDNIQLEKKSGAGYLPGVKRFTLAALVAVFVIQFIFPASFMDFAVNYITAAAVLVSLPFAGLGTGIISMVLFISGTFLIFTSGAGWHYLAGAMGKNTSLLVLLMAVPMLGIPLKQGGYIGVMDALALKYMRSRRQMYWVPALFSHVLGVFMNLGAVPLTHEITARGEMVKHPGLHAKSLSRGFSAALFWSPNMVATALVLAYLDVPWQNYAHLGILFACIALVTGFVTGLFEREGRVIEAGPAPGVEGPYIDRVRLAQLTAAGAVFLLTIVLIETKTSLPVIRTIPLIAIILPAVWLYLLGRREYIGAGYADYFRNRIDKFDGEVVMFAAAGFFSSAFAVSGWSEKLSAGIIMFSGHSKVAVALTILASIILPGLAGIHPMVMVSAFAASLDPASLGFSQVQMALVLISGWALGATVSPMSGTSLCVAGLTGKTPIEVGYVNLPHVLMVIIAIVLYFSWF